MYLPAWPRPGIEGVVRHDWLPSSAVSARSTKHNLFSHGPERHLLPVQGTGEERPWRGAGARLPHGQRSAGDSCVRAQIVWYPATRRFEIDLDGLRRCCQRARAQVLFVIHYAGWPQPIEALRTFCEEYGLILVEDCAMALLTEREGRPVGSGDYAIFCLYKTLPLPGWSRPHPESRAIRPVGNSAVAAKRPNLHRRPHR